MLAYVHVRVCALADVDWLDHVTASRHLSPNHDLCCRLLSHIPLLAAYTGWPTENHLHINSQAGTRTTTNSNSGSDVTEHSVAVGLDGGDQGLHLSKNRLRKWRPSEKDKKYIEETVRSLVDSEDLCRLLMVAMATELERLTGSEDGDENSSEVDTSPRHVVQSSADSAADDRDHGDTTQHDDTTQQYDATQHDNTTQDVANQPPKSRTPLESSCCQTGGGFDARLMGKVAHCRKSTGDRDDAGTGTIVFDDAKSASSTPASTDSVQSPDSVEKSPGRHSGESIGKNSAWALLRRKKFDDELKTSARRALSTSNSLDVELRDAIRRMENTTKTGTNQVHYKLILDTLNSSPHRVDDTQVVDVDGTVSAGSSWLLMQASSVHDKHLDSTNTSPANTHVELLVEPQPSTELCPFSAVGVVKYGANVERVDRIDNISGTEPRPLVDFHRGTTDQQADCGYHHYDYDSVKTALEHKNSTAEVGRDGRKTTEVEEPLSSRRTGTIEEEALSGRQRGRAEDGPMSGRGTDRVGDDCRVKFRPRQQALPVPARQISSGNSSLAMETSRHQFNRTSTRTSDLTQSSGRGRRLRSTPHDVKCAVRRKTVVV